MIKKGQVAIFVILALLVIAMGVSYFFIRNNSSSNLSNSPEISGVQKQVKKCMQNLVDQATIALDLKGGYTQIPSNRPSIDNLLPIYLVNNTFFIPSEKDLAQQMRLYLNKDLKQKLDACLAEIKDNMTLVTGKASSEVVVKESHFLINLNYPITLTQDENKYSVKSFNNILVTSNLLKMMFVSKEILEEYAKNSSEPCLSCVYTIAETRNVSLEIFSFEEKEMLFTLTDLDYNLAGNYTKFNFITK